MNRLRTTLFCAALFAALPLRAETDNDFALNPTGGAIRTEGMDKWGGGEYLARRNHEDSNGLSLHYGVDYCGAAGQDVLAPIGGRLTRTGSGAKAGADIVGLIRGQKHRVKLLHVTIRVPDGDVNQGQVIGTVKNMGRYYPGMVPHVHMEVHGWRDHFGYRPKDPAIVLKQENTSPMETALGNADRSKQSDDQVGAKPVTAGPLP
jgi:murein DD-endopeptidase MepM/ murein hydrolase activator NlpD